ncbi:Telomeric DNA binding protein 1, putative isoform 2 [Hibiscus syriacus]|uniref:Telomeric DNA binding protein 1, putative isoform 2 n=1 Tax=Hibiscus syriacus TaxID=106335 RepID=A0A6A2YUK3_HIBSY|nr:telomere repeat-binding protein 3-like [Hibiscus syriacus]KAE8683086.1 Telomeric DNA binding protein 1, putative isoform 2 [Hibiscus syriacus]
MVFKKRLDYGFDTFDVPIVPRAPRSNRRRYRSRRDVDDSQICAFELLASLAGKLLQESESAACINASEGHDRVSIGKDVVKQEIHSDDDKTLKTECVEQGSCEVSESTTENSDNVKGFKPSGNDAILDRGLIKARPACSKQKSGDVKSMIRNGNAAAYENFCGDRDLCTPDLGDFCDGKTGSGFKQERNGKGLDIGKSSIANTCPLKDHVEPVNSKRASWKDRIPNASFSRHRNNIKFGSKDDDENFSRFNGLRYRFKASRPPSRIGDRRIRKLLASKYWKVGPKLKDSDHCKADGGMKPLYHKRKAYYNHDRYQYDVLYKRRKLFDRSSIVTSDGGISSESVCNSPQKVVDGDKGSSASMSHGACRIPPLLTGNKASHQCKDSHVRFSIKSFRIPELYIEVPESTTVGSLKRTVFEAVTALLGGGIRVGVLLEGKKVRDDNRTLSQTGISCEDNLDSIGFTLEPGPTKAPPPVCSEEASLPISCDKAPETLTRFPATLVVDTGISNAASHPLLLTNSAHPVDTNHEPVSSLTDALTGQSLSELRALVPVPAMNAEALSVIPASPKARKPELAQRRTRRPFSVLEVEALVQAVEELGTGRWRDIKLRAFENADHRTYVDLKDKWKTLVHTAKISPQQRRGQPVPQELLDRVLAAHAHWSQHQAKPQGKPQPGTLRITDKESDGNGVATTVPTAPV